MPESFECLPSWRRSATRRIAVIAVVATVVPALGISTASASRLAPVKGEASGHAPVQRYRTCSGCSAALTGHSPRAPSSGWHLTAPAV